MVRCAKAGCAAPEILAHAQQVPRGVPVAPSAVFWTTGDGKVWRRDLPPGVEVVESPVHGLLVP